VVVGSSVDVTAFAQHYVMHVLHSLHEGRSAIAMTHADIGSITVKAGRTPGHVRFPTRTLTCSSTDVLGTVVSVPLRTSPSLRRGSYEVELFDDGRFAKKGVRLYAARIELR
jgi:hypothetical protein